jgi:hypothetical protein
MSKNAVGRLSLMMFLQYAVWGAWLPLAARYLSAPSAEGGLGFTGAQIGMILGLAGSIGAMAWPTATSVPSASSPSCSPSAA